MFIHLYILFAYHLSVVYSNSAHVFEMTRRCDKCQVCDCLPEVGVHTVYIYSVPLHIVIFANDTDTFPIFIVLSFSKFVIKQRDE